MPALEIKGLRKSFEEVTAVRDVSLTVNPGEILGLLGPNGAGKTTTIRAVMGIVAPDAGDIRIHDQAPTIELRRRIGYSPGGTRAPSGRAHAGRGGIPRAPQGARPRPGPVPRRVLARATGPWRGDCSKNRRAQPRNGAESADRGHAAHRPGHPDPGRADAKPRPDQRQAPARHHSRTPRRRGGHRHQHSRHEPGRGPGRPHPPHRRRPRRRGGPRGGRPPRLRPQRRAVRIARSRRRSPRRCRTSRRGRRLLRRAR